MSNKSYQEISDAQARNKWIQVLSRIIFGSFNTPNKFSNFLTKVCKHSVVSVSKPAEWVASDSLTSCCWTKLGRCIKDYQKPGESLMSVTVVVSTEGNRCSNLPFTYSFPPHKQLWMCANIIHFSHLFLVPGNSGEL